MFLVACKLKAGGVCGTNLTDLMVQVRICLAPLPIKIPESLLFYCIIFMELHGKVFPKKHSGYKARYAAIGKCGNRRISIKSKIRHLRLQKRACITGQAKR